MLISVSIFRFLVIVNLNRRPFRRKLGRRFLSNWIIYFKSGSSSSASASFSAVIFILLVNFNSDNLNGWSEVFCMQHVACDWAHALSFY